jgi:gamma-glutamyltranspeptidase
MMTEDPDHFIECSNGVVVSVSGPASDIGRDILKRGGAASLHRQCK